MGYKLNEFPVIEGQYYGCDQSWFGDSDKQNSGCGAAAAANLALYYAGSLEPTKDEALKVMDSIYDDYIKQTIRIKGTGVWFMGEFKKGMLKWFSDNGISVKALTMNDIFSKDPLEAARFISTALDKGCPPVLLLWQSSFEVPRHYVTITEAEENGEDFNLTVSTWGEKRVYENFLKTWNEPGIMNSAFLLYFERV
jgi:hypothetical protein